MKIEQVSKGDFVELVNGRVARVTSIKNRLLTCRNVITGQPHRIYASSVKRVIDADNQWNHEQSHMKG